VVDVLLGLGRPATAALARRVAAHAAA